MCSATPNPHIPRYSLPIISSICCSIWRKVRWTQGGKYSGSLCLFRSFSLQGTFYEQALMCTGDFSEGSSAKSVLETGTQKAGLVPTSKASANNIWSDNKRQRGVSHHNPSAGVTYFSNTWELRQNGLDEQNPPNQLLKSRERKQSDSTNPNVKNLSSWYCGTTF